MQALHFGAGNIGRGFVGEILHRAGFHICFADVNEEIISALNEQGTYEVIYAEEDDPTVPIQGISALNSASESEEIVRQIVDADLITTAVGPAVLEKIAPLLAKGLSKRAAAGKEPVDVIACENMIGGSELLKGHVLANVAQAEEAEVKTVAGFPNAAVDRIVPNQDGAEQLLNVKVEPFFEWVIETPAMKNRETSTSLPGVTYVSDLNPYVERKLFTVNTGHAALAYLGAYHNVDAVPDAIRHDAVTPVLQGVLQETGELLERKYGFSREDMQAYHAKILERFKNPYLADDVRRVGRQPLRKLAADDRLVNPFLQLREKGVDAPNLLTTIASAFLFDVEADEESQALKQRLQTESTEKVVAEVIGSEDEEVINIITEKIKALADS